MKKTYCIFAGILFLIIFTANSYALTTVFEDNFNRGDLYKTWFESRNDGVSQIDVSSSILNITVKKPNQDCDALDLQTLETFNGTNLYLESIIKQNGYGCSGISLIHDDLNYVRLRLNTDDVPYIQFASCDNGVVSQQQIGNSSAYIGKYVEFKIEKIGNQYSAFLDGVKQGQTYSNNGIGDSNIAVELINNTCVWKSGDANNDYDYVSLKKDGGTWELVYATLFRETNSLNLLREFRDRVLAKSPLGKLYTRLTYQNSIQATKVFLDNPPLAKAAAYLIDSNIQSVQSVLGGQEGIIYNTDEIIMFLENFALVSPESLKYFATTIKDELKLKKNNGEDFFGFTLR